MVEVFKKTMLDAIEDFCDFHINNIHVGKVCEKMKREVKRLRKKPATVPMVMGTALWLANWLAEMGCLFGLGPNKVNLVKIPSHLDEKLVKRCLLLSSACLALQYLPREREADDR